MSKQLEQALREYQDAVARSVASHEAQDSDTRKERVESNGAYQALLAGYSSDDVMVAWTRYLDLWAEEGAGEWWQPWSKSS